MAETVRFVDLGTLAGDTDLGLWRGAISLARRVEDGDLTTSEVEAAVGTLPHFFVPTTPGASKRCIDGSTVEGYSVTEPAWQKRPLGPQIQGGTVDEAVAWRLTEGVTQSGIKLLDDVRHLAQVRQSNFAEGDHTDNHADATKTGCGAIDGQQRKLALYADPESAKVMRSLAATILSLVSFEPTDESFKDIQVAAMALNQLPDYFAPPNEILDTLRSLNPNGVEKLIRPHAEVSLTLNFVPGSTFDRDNYNAQSNNRIQNFNLDAWVILEEYGPRGYALVLDAVATAMDLTDGSQRLFARL